MSPEHNSLLTYSRRDVDTGELTLIQVAFDNINGANGTGGAAAITITSNGEWAYIAAPGQQSISLFARDPDTGLLSLSRQLVVSDLTAPVRSMAVSLDQSLLFVATDQQLMIFGLDVEDFSPFRMMSSDSRLQFAAQDIAISPDSQDIYVTASGRPAA